MELGEPDTYNINATNAEMGEPRGRRGLLFLSSEF